MNDIKIMFKQAQEALETLKKYCVSDLWLYENKADEDINGCDEAVEYNEAVDIVEQSLAELEELKKDFKRYLKVNLYLIAWHGGFWLKEKLPNESNEDTLKRLRREHEALEIKIGIEGWAK